MKHTILRGLAISALLIGAPLSAAHAADMAVPAPPPPAPVHSWTGMYFDVGAGWQRNSDNWNFNFPGVANGATSESASGGSIGGHVGYQQQFGWLVVGGEIGAVRSTSEQWASVTSTGAGGCGAVFAAGIQCGVKVDSVSTFGGKLGVVVPSYANWLVYGVGGAAFGANVASRTWDPPVFTPTFTAPQNAHGWYAGGGVDFMTFKTQLIDMILGVEYQHIDLGTVQGFSVNNGFAPGNEQRAIGAKEDIVLAKLTVKWNPLGM